MIFQDAIQFVIQGESGIHAIDGIHSDGALAVGVDTRHGLLAMVEGRSGDTAIAEKTLEILIDDMQLNLPVLQQKRSSKSDTLAESRCLQESLENINEYLLVYAHERGLVDTQWGVSLGVFQFSPSTLCCCLYGDFEAYHCRDGQLSTLSLHQVNDKLLGQDTSFQADAKEQGLLATDTLVMISRKAVAAIGSEFLRLTLSRFGTIWIWLNARSMHGPSTRACR